MQDCEYQYDKQAVTPFNALLLSVPAGNDEPEIPSQQHITRNRRPPRPCPCLLRPGCSVAGTLRRSAPAPSTTRGPCRRVYGGTAGSGEICLGRRRDLPERKGCSVSSRICSNRVGRMGTCLWRPSRLVKATSRQRGPPRPSQAHKALADQAGLAPRDSTRHAALTTRGSK